MKKSKKSIFGVLFLLLLGMGRFYPVWSHPVDKDKVVRFTENLGQWPSNIRGFAEVPGGRLYLTDTAFIFHFIDYHALDSAYHQRNEHPEMQFGNHVLIVGFKGANPKSQFQMTESYADYSNYFIGSDPSKWKSRVKHYTTCSYTNLYPNIDLVLRGEQNSIKYDLILRPGARVEDICMLYQGADKIKVEKEILKVTTSLGEMQDAPPVLLNVYQQLWKEGKVKYAVKQGAKDAEVRFQVQGTLPKNKTWILDPKLTFSTFNGSYLDSWGYTATYDEKGHVYSGGIVLQNGGPNFNNNLSYNQLYYLSSGAFSSIFSGGQTDGTIIQYDPTGTNRIYATYFGGKGNDIPHSTIANDRGELYIYGSTSSNNFPMALQAYDPSYNGGDSLRPLRYRMTGSDMYVIKLNASGTAILGSTYLGGTGNDGTNTFYGRNSYYYNYGDEFRGEINLDALGHVWVAGTTESKDAPIVNGFQKNLSGQQDGYICKLDSNLTTLLASSYFGGLERDAAFSIQFDPKNNPVFCGGTASVTLPGIDAKSFQQTNKGIVDGFVTKMSPNLDTIFRSTFLGTDSSDQAFFVQVDKQGGIYTLGQSTGLYPYLSTIGTIYRDKHAPQFIHKLTSNLDSTIFSTSFGDTTTRRNLSPTGFSVNFCGQIMVSGWFGDLHRLNGATSTTRYMPITPNAFQKNSIDLNDYYFCSFKKDMKALDYGSYFGGIAAEHVDGGTCRFDKNGIAYQTICGSCGYRFGSPTTINAWSNRNNGVLCNMLAVKFDFQYPIANAGDPKNACDGTSVQLKATGGSTYQWRPDPGISCISCSTQTFVPNATRYYKVVVDDGFGCTSTDSVLVSVFPQAKANFGIVQPKCSYEVQFKDSSIFANKLHWDFGLPYTKRDTSNLSQLNFVYPRDSVYRIRLIAKGSYVCNDTLEKAIVIKNQITGANFSFIGNCEGELYTFQDQSRLSSGTAQSYQWLYSNLPFPNAPKVEKTLLAGTKPMTLVVTNEDGCKDTIQKNIPVYKVPNLRISKDSSICDGTMAVVKATTDQKLQWLLPPGLACDTCFLQKRFLTGSQFWKVKAYDGTCIRFDSTRTTWLPQPKAVFDFTNIKCQPLISFNNQSLKSSQYLWQFSANLKDTSSLKNPSKTYSRDGLYRVKLTVDPKNQCFDTISKVIQIDNEISGANFTFSPSCLGLPVFFRDASALTFGTPNSWTWSLGKGGIKSGQNTQETYQILKTYPIQLVVGTQEGCTDTILKVVKVANNPIIDLGPNGSVCDGKSYQVVLQRDRNNYQYTWLKNPLELSCLNCPEPLIRPFRAKYYVLLAVSPENCESKDSILVNIIPVLRPEVSFDVILPRCFNEPVTFLPKLEDYDPFCRGIPKYKWLWDNGQIDSIFAPKHQFDRSGFHQVIFQVNGSAPYSKTIYLNPIDSCEKNIWVPNAFTPNADGQNDILYVRGLNVRDVNFRLYNRWGELVFETNRLAQGWDGIYKGSKATAQVYVYQLQASFFDGSEVSQKGNVTLVE